MATKFIFLILPGIHLLDLAGPNQAILEAIDYGANFKIEYCGTEEKTITTSGLPLSTVNHFSKIKYKKGDYLIIPGIDFKEITKKGFKDQTKLFRWIRKLYDEGVVMVSICVGAFILAESGLLNGKKCTTHFKKTNALQQKYPEIQVIENVLFTEEDQVYTSAGIASGIDLTLHIIEKLKGPYFASKVARELVVYHRRKGNETQYSEQFEGRNHIHAGIHKVQDYIFENLQQKHSLTQLASVANMSERNFTRIFKKETGYSVHEYITLLRLSKIQILLQNPDLTKTAIANKVGLQSEKQLNRILHLNSITSN